MREKRSGLSIAITIGVPAALGLAVGLLSVIGVQFAIILSIVVVVAAAIGLLSLRPMFLKWIAYSSVALTFFDTASAALGPVNVRVYQVLSIFLLASISSRIQRSGNSFGPLLKWLVIFTISVGLSLFWTISPSDTLSVTAGQVYLLYLFLILVFMLNVRIVSVKGLLIAMWVGATLCCTSACIQFVLGLAHIDWNLQYVQGIPWGRPGGLMTEPDWSALVAAINLMLTIVLRLRARWVVFGVVVSVVTLGTTLIRTVLLALVVAGVATALNRHSGRLKTLIAVGAPVIAIVALIVEIYVPNAISRLNPSTIGTAQSDGGALNSRLAVLSLIGGQGSVPPWTGNGAGSLAFVTQLPSTARAYAGGGQLNAGHGSANILATAFWDTGWPGAVVVTLTLGSWLLSGWKVRRSVPVLWPLAALLIADFQANNGIRFGFVWVLFAIVSYEVVSDPSAERSNSQLPDGSPETRRPPVRQRSLLS